MDSRVVTEILSQKSHRQTSAAEGRKLRPIPFEARDKKELSGTLEHPP
jgi:hypothetical protein